MCILFVERTARKIDVSVLLSAAGNPRYGTINRNSITHEVFLCKSIFDEVLKVCSQELEAVQVIGKQNRFSALIYFVWDSSMCNT